MGGHDPGGACGDPAVGHHLRQGDEAQQGIAAGDELVGLGDVFALDEPGLERVQQIQRGQGFDGGGTVGSEFRIGQGFRMLPAASTTPAFADHSTRRPVA